MRNRTENRKFKLLFVFGTRPEALKLMPVIEETKRHSNRFKVITCLTGQHREMVDQVLKLFKLKADIDLNLMRRDQKLSRLTQKVFSKMDGILAGLQPDLIIVQGDTTTVLAVALKAFYEKIPVAHIEAGLRTHRKYEPFPEEMNRVLVTHIADYHFAPTATARKNLLREGVPPSRIYVTGNTVVDALKMVRSKLAGSYPVVLKHIPASRRVILVTAHRRESFGKPLRDICLALRDLVRKFPDIEIIYPVHMNPRVKGVASEVLQGVRRIHLIEPLPYIDFITLLKRSYFILTDSGGVQEEAPSFSKPVLVMRSVSERLEGTRMKVAKVIGTSRKVIVAEAGRLLENPAVYRRMVRRHNPYGDGFASQRIVSTLLAMASEKAKSLS